MSSTHYYFSYLISFHDNILLGQAIEVSHDSVSARKPVVDMNPLPAQGGRDPNRWVLMWKIKNGKERASQVRYSVTPLSPRRFRLRFAMCTREELERRKALARLPYTVLPKVACEACLSRESDPPPPYIYILSVFLSPFIWFSHFFQK